LLLLLYLCARVLLGHQTTTSSAYGIYVMTPVEQITRYALIAVSSARQHNRGVRAALRSNWQQQCRCSRLATYGCNCKSKHYACAQGRCF
jgi:hypothetical protein